MSRFAPFFLLLTFYSLSAMAQVIEGTVFDEMMKPLSEVHVQVQKCELNTMTAEDGTFEMDLDGCSKEDNRILATRVGFQPKEMNLLPGKPITDLIIQMQPLVYESETVVVTATRTRRDIEEVTIPVSVVGKQEIERSGSMRLSDILAEQTGMQIVSDHGTGLQVQGFDPDYTLIMIDGNPVIGRTAGTLELDRISVRNVKQIEIVKGPSSALWGSDALAGVVNIITQVSSRPLSGGFTIRYGENETLDLAGDVSFQTGRWSNNLFLNRNASDGYRIDSNSAGQTVPDYENYTLSYRTDLELSDRITFDASLRYFTENQENTDQITDEEENQHYLNSDASRKDFVINPTLSVQPAERLDLSVGLQSSFYKTESDLTYLESGDVYASTNFKQYYNKPEFQAGFRWSDRHHSLVGGGVIFERLEADRYPDEPNFTTQFLFAQHSWTPVQKLELTAGFRYDVHSEYSSQLSPKFSARYNAKDWLQFRASVGRGFKAPEFRQLFLDFTNATSGYSVFGSSTVLEGLHQLEETGQISHILISPDQIEEIQAESSIAANVGVDMNLSSQFRFRVNLFRNNVSDLIETAPIARKTNGQSVFTYFNLEEIYTQGAEAEIRWTVLSALQASVGYQFLDARRLIEEERTVQNSDGEVETRMFSSHEPMLNRSRHSGNIKLFYENDAGWGGNIRGMFRGKYGLFDTNGNGFADENEYENGYTLWNAAVSKRLLEKFILQAGADNLFDYTNENIPSLPGRLWYAQVSVEF